MRLLVTGGAGFIGSNFIRLILAEYPYWQVTNLDKLTYAGNLENLSDIEGNPGYKFVRGDISDRVLVDGVLDVGFNAIINFAAESHVDRSILDPSAFIQTNIVGTQVLLESARKHKIARFLQVSTDEVYGSIASGAFNETSPLSPNSPYAASKASADLLCLAYWRTFATPVVVTRCGNNFGPYQFPEKLIPLAATNALDGKEVPVYGDGLNVRDWIFVLDHCRALAMVLAFGRIGEVYNIGAGNEKSNLDLLNELLVAVGRPASLLKFVSDRPGHDRRYALDTKKIRTELGWSTDTAFKQALADTAKWYAGSESWWRRIKNGEYMNYYERMYKNR